MDQLHFSKLSRILLSYNLSSLFNVCYIRIHIQIIIWLLVVTSRLFFFALKILLLIFWCRCHARRCGSIECNFLLISCKAELRYLQEIGDLKQLQQLDCTENRLVRLPDQLAGLANLTDLHLSQNQIGEIPDGICELVKLSVELSLICICACDCFMISL